MFHVHNIIFDFYIHYSMHTMKSSVPTVDPLYLSWPPSSPFPSSNHYRILCIYVEYKKQTNKNK